ncbi:ABC transporter permease [Kaistia dalseonensis]|uniref:ABC transport system permease protein n=1 Tax=Kaistia dalseonensis TaxID=410840 RepID=A0ABU0H2M8_9HYPH|nr:ABC transporter permease [Kaistia dalseonensis]MCX5493194.1 ABC transporter permease [Kaistia dalseonensis]MDQ0435749.1 putative ABC transport system permease protein [Kaistia dalseonensis]
MIRFVLADLRRLWAGSLVVILLVALATALGIAVTLQERALRLGSARAADKFDLVVGAAGSETQLVLSAVFLQAAPLPLVPGKVLHDLSADPRVTWAAPVGFGDSFRGFPIIGTTVTLIAGAGGGIAEGKAFDALDQAVVGSAVPLAIGQQAKPMHGMPGEGGHVHEGLTYHVVGRMAPTGTPWDRAILVPIEAVWKLHGMEEAEDHDHHDADHDEADRADHHDDEAAPVALGGPWSDTTPGVPAILVKPKTIADAYKLRGDYRSGSTLAVFPGEVLTRLYATLGDAKAVLNWVAIGAQLLVAAAIALVTIVHVSQRRRQIGALRAFGAPRLAVFGIVWIELFLLVGIGILAGFGLGYGAARIMSALFTRENGVVLPVEFTLGDVRLGLVLMAVSALLAALPAWLAYREPPAAALRS